MLHTTTIATHATFPQTYNNAILLEQEVAVDLLLPADQVEPLSHLGGSHVPHKVWDLQLEFQLLAVFGDLNIWG